MEPPLFRTHLTAYRLLRSRSTFCWPFNTYMEDTLGPEPERGKWPEHYLEEPVPDLLA